MDQRILIKEQLMNTEIQYEWGVYINISDKTYDVVKSSYKDDDDDFGEDTIVRTVEWIEGYSYMDMVEYLHRIRELKGYSFIEVNVQL